MSEDSATLHSMDTRLAVVESGMLEGKKTKKWIQGIVVIFVLQSLGGAAAIGGLFQKVGDIDLTDIRATYTANRTILTSHSAEIESVRAENARLRGVIDSIRDEITSRTADRFTGAQANRMADRILRLEEARMKAAERQGEGE